MGCHVQEVASLLLGSPALGHVAHDAEQDSLAADVRAERADLDGEDAAVAATVDGLEEGALGVCARHLLAGQTNNLAPSNMANDQLAVGTRVQIRPQLQSFVRTLPGPDQGDPVGYLQNGATATIVGGPVWLPGETDTIVWWYVELPDGTQGWTPANTSKLTLLDPAP